MYHDTDRESRRNLTTEPVRRFSNVETLMTPLQILLILLIVPVTGAQTAAAGRENPARKLLNRAIRAQDPAGVALRVTSYHGEATYRYLDPGKNGGTKEIVGEIVQDWAASRSRGGKRVFAYRRELRPDTGGAQTLIAPFDDRFWKKGKRGRPIILVGEAFKEDVKRLKKERRLIAELMDLFFLARQAVDEDTLRLAPAPETVSFVMGGSRRIGRRTFHARRLDFRTKSGQAVTLWIDEATSFVVKARVERNGNVQEYHLSRHAAVQVPGEGAPMHVIVPREVQYMEKGVMRLEVRAKPDGLRFNALDEAAMHNLFDLPE